MPLLSFKCPQCDQIIEDTFVHNGGEYPECCGQTMQRVYRPIAFVKMKGEGGYPSRRKFFKGSAPGTTRATQEWSPGVNFNAPSLGSYPTRQA